MNQSSTLATSKDWRVNMFGSSIRRNTQSARDEESPVETVSTEEAFDQSVYDYIAVFIGANYCPHCKAFAPTVVASARTLEEKHKTKVVFVSNDRDTDNYEASVAKNVGIDIVPYDLEKTKAMRDMFELKTIPALMILRNDGFGNASPTVVTNARHALAEDPKASNFPWTATEDSISAMDRLIIRGKYGKWWELGHHSNPEKPDEIYMDEHAVRARAGILNIITWIAIINVFFWKEPKFVYVLFPLVSFEFMTSMTFGLTPIAPVGFLGSLLAIALYDKPHWKPARPKRFAWAIGLFLATSCLTFFLFRKDLGEAYIPLVGLSVLSCNLATWLESACGFCLGCFIYNTYLTKWFHLEECQECKI